MCVFDLVATALSYSPLTCSWVLWVRFPSELDTWHLYRPDVSRVTVARDRVPLSSWQRERGVGWMGWGYYDALI